MADAFVLGGVRTPDGRYGGSLAHIRTDLLGRTMVGACERVGVRPERVEDITAARSRIGRAGGRPARRARSRGCVRGR